ncbi:MAG: hemerythrin domain-containing protein [Thermanaeromonas sp.]|nr:hemerythrin domain-containing protein [Thermanaeromonas sp.]MCG0278095.1 hemerythrin domain-containing protein [Thermanaeromonas sp.]
MFPYLEKYNITGPPKVMWGVDDEIRGLIKEAKTLALHYAPGKKEELLGKVREALGKVSDMIFLLSAVE